MNSDNIVAIMLPSMFSWIAWVIFSGVRRYKIAKLQADVQTKLIEKVGSGQELLAYAQTDTGKELLQSLRVERVSPYGRIIGALQTGIVLILLGVTMLLLRTHVDDAKKGFVVLGSLISALGFGFSLSALASYYLSKSFGLFNSASNHGR